MPGVYSYCEDWLDYLLREDDFCPKVFTEEETLAWTTSIQTLLAIGQSGVISAASVPIADSFDNCTVQELLDGSASMKRSTVLRLPTERQAQIQGPCVIQLCARLTQEHESCKQVKILEELQMLNVSPTTLSMRSMRGAIISLYQFRTRDNLDCMVKISARMIQEAYLAIFTGETLRSCPNYFFEDKDASQRCRGQLGGA